MSSYAKRLHDAPNIQEALSILGEGIDEVLKLLPDYVDGLGKPTDAFMQWPSTAVSVNHDGDNTVVDIPAVSEEKRELRRKFAAEVLKIDEYYLDGSGNPILPKPDDPALKWSDVYASGGPVWLYENDREFVMTLSPAVKQILVTDVIEFDPRYGHEMGRDILKADADDSRAQANLEGWSPN